MSGVTDCGKFSSSHFSTQAQIAGIRFESITLSQIRPSVPTSSEDGLSIPSSTNCACLIFNGSDNVTNPGYRSILDCTNFDTGITFLPFGVSLYATVIALVPQSGAVPFETCAILHEYIPVSGVTV